MSNARTEFNNEHIPFGYLITFRTYGTWLHGDTRESVDRFHNRYESEFIPPNERWRNYNLRGLSQQPVKLGARQRAAVEAAIRETCKIRRWGLWAINLELITFTVLSPPCANQTRSSLLLRQTPRAG